MIGVGGGILHALGGGLEPRGRGVAQRADLHLIDLLQLRDDRAPLASRADDPHTQRPALDSREQLVRLRHQSDSRERTHRVGDEPAAIGLFRPLAPGPRPLFLHAGTALAMHR